MKQEAQFTLTISRVNEQVFAGSAHSVTLPGEAGQFTVLAHHEPVITLLKHGTITVRTESGDQTFAIERGMCEISNNQVTILVQL